MESLAYAKEWYTSTVIHGNSRSVDGCARSIQLPLTQSIFLASRLSTGDLAVKSIQLNDPKMRMTADQVELKVDLPIYS